MMPTTLDEVKKYEGKDIIILTKNKTVYAGRVSNVRAPGNGEIKPDNVAIMDFNHYRWCKIARRCEIEEPTLFEQRHATDFPIRESDVMNEFNVPTLLEKLHEHGYIEILYKPV